MIEYLVGDQLMNRARILIVEDDPLWQKTLLHVLEPQAAYVTTAASLPEAFCLLGQRYFNVAIVDLSLKPGDPKDEQGMAFLQHLQEQHLAETVRCIILSAFGNIKKTRRAFHDFHVVDFLEKDEFSALALTSAVIQALAENGLDREMSIEFADGHNLDDLLARFNWARREDPFQLQPELYDLLLRLFRDAKHLLIRGLPAGQSGAGVLHVEPDYKSGAGTPVVVKFGKKEKIRKERDNYDNYVQQFVGSYSSTQLRHALGWVMGAVSYQLIGTELNTIVSFADYYRQHSAEEVCDALERLFTNTCGRWYDNRDGGHHSRDFLKLYESGLHIDWAAVWQGAADTGVDLDKRQIEFPGLAGRYVNPKLWLQANAKNAFIPAWQAITHGDLNEQNILVTAQGDCWLIDFYRTEPNHILRDVAELETALKFNLLETEGLAEFQRFDRRLLKQTKLTEPVEVGIRSQSYKPLTVISHLRKLADPMAGSTNEMTEYFWGLLLTTLNLLRLETLRPRRREALLSASMLCERLTQ
jgi:ActR/RegA family two-component response regulator